ncbi:MAG: hypothetical protein P4L92_10105 [Rudaea sp.]|nr:hypothetical protein [Rudaea sp.]
MVAGSGNVFTDLGFDVAEAQVVALCTELMARLRKHLADQEWTQTEAARLLASPNRACRR